MEFSCLLSGGFLNKHRMTPLRLLIKNTLIKMTGNRFCQNMLEELVQTALILMGIGTGSSGGCEVLTSGEKAIFATLKQILSGPYCIFDVGSNKGQFLQLTLDNIATEHYSVHCFEPGRETFRCLDKSYCHDKRIKLNNIGIGREQSEALLYYDAAGSGCASLTKRKLDHLDIHFDQCETVRLTTIDDYCSENEINHIHLLKMDIEGHELDALIGARHMFEQKAIDIVTFEFGGCNVDTKTFFRDFWYFFSEAGMKLYRITPTGYLYPIESYSEIHERILVSNFMAIANGL